MHIKGQLYWFVLTILFFIVACQPKHDEAWLLENIDNIENTIHSDGLVFYTHNILENRQKVLYQHSDDLSKVKYNKLSDEAKLHYLDLKHLIDFEIYLQDTLRIFEWDATLYRITPQVRILAEVQRPEKERFTNINELLAVSDSFYQIAKGNIVSSIAIENGKLAVEQHASDFLYLQNDLMKQIEESTLSDDFKNELLENLSNTLLNIKDYIGYVTSMINNTDDLDDTTSIITENLGEIMLRKYLGKNIEKMEIIESLNKQMNPDDGVFTDSKLNASQILEKEHYYFTIEELNELEENGDSTILDFIMLLAQKELGLVEENELLIPFQKILDEQKDNMGMFPYRYTGQVQNYLMYQEYKDFLKRKGKNEELIAMDAYIRQFKDTPFIFIKQVLEE